MIYFSLERTLIVTTQFLRYALFVYLIYQIFTRAFKREVLIWTIWDWNIICPGFVFRIWSTACAWKWLLRVFVVCSMNAAIMCDLGMQCLLTILTWFSKLVLSVKYLQSNPPPPLTDIVLSLWGRLEGHLKWLDLYGALLWLALFKTLDYREQERITLS